MFSKDDGVLTIAIGLSHYNVANNSIQLGEAMEYNVFPRDRSSQHRVVSVVPYFPAGGLIAGIFSGRCDHLQPRAF